jgi:hypothetical protein
VQKVVHLVRVVQDHPPMLEAIIAVFVVLSIGILVAHALDAFRP